MTRTPEEVFTHHSRALDAGDLDEIVTDYHDDAICISPGGVLRGKERIAKYDLAGWIGIQDTPNELTKWRITIQRELEKIDSPRSADDLEISSMIWFTITDEASDQTDKGKATNLLVGTASEITDMLKRYQEAGLTMPMLWPPFQGVPVSKTLDDMKRLKEEIMPQVAA
jgi:alkanesulfonate monooxygenase SsuD/methylene tetrahydromethanopterin reductase-like flavin-dependent oxidoreductase (luciferase family)